MIYLLFPESRSLCIQVGSHTKEIEHYHTEIKAAKENKEKYLQFISSCKDNSSSTIEPVFKYLYSILMFKYYQKSNKVSKIINNSLSQVLNKELFNKMFLFDETAKNTGLPIPSELMTHIKSDLIILNKKPYNSL